MTVAQQSQSLSDSIVKLRGTLDEIENAQRADDHLLALQLAELIGDSADAILWSATALARQVPGASWTVIGGRLGITRQAAQQRLGGAGQPTAPEERIGPDVPRIVTEFSRPL